MRRPVVAAVVVIDHAEAVVRPAAGGRGRGAQDPQAGRSPARAGGLDPSGPDGRPRPARCRPRHMPRDLAVVGSGDIEDAATPARHSPRSPRASGRSPSVRWYASPNIWTATGPTLCGTSSYRTAWSSE